MPMSITTDDCVYMHQIAATLGLSMLLVFPRNIYCLTNFLANQVDYTYLSTAHLIGLVKWLPQSRHVAI